eukprot:351343-Prymnesium_polylepis.2
MPRQRCWPWQLGRAQLSRPRAHAALDQALPSPSQLLLVHLKALPPEPASPQPAPAASVAVLLGPPAWCPAEESPPCARLRGAQRRGDGRRCGDGGRHRGDDGRTCGS